MERKQWTHVCMATCKTNNFALEENISGMNQQGTLLFVETIKPPRRD